jgi:hypothetical protein
MISNVEVAAGRQARGDFYVGARQNVLHRVNGARKIACRRLVFDQAVLAAKKVDTFF